MASAPGRTGWPGREARTPGGVDPPGDAPAGLDGYGRAVYTEPDVPPPKVRPPLTKRLRLRHWVILDCLVAVPALALLVLAFRSGLTDRADAYGAASFLMVTPFGVAGALAIALRRLWPVLALTVLLAVSVLLAFIEAPSGLSAGLAAAYVLYIVAANRPRRFSAVALASTIAVLLIEALAGLGQQAGGTGAVVPIALVVVVFWVFGLMVRQRRAYTNGLQRQAASRAVTEERLRIARELHDVVAHSMSVIAVQAGFGEYVIDDQPAKAREALGAIQATSRDALDEMRRMLSVLRQADQGGEPAPAQRYALRDLAADPPASENGATGSTLASSGADRAAAAPLRPAPGLADLDRLITRVGHAGVHVDLRVSGDRGNVPAGVDLSAFRIVQEALTNVVKHAATPDCRVTIDYGEQKLSLEIVDGGRGSPAAGGPLTGDGAVPAVTAPNGTPLALGLSSGHGLIGMSERVHLCGGQFSAGPLPERGFRVAAVLPLAGPE